MRKYEPKRGIERLESRRMLAFTLSTSGSEYYQQQISHFDIHANAVLLQSSIAADDFLLDGAATESVEVVSPSQVRIHFPVLSEGEHTISVAKGAIENNAGHFNLPLDLMIHIDLTSPTVVATPIPDLQDGLLEFDVLFSESLSGSSIQIDGPQGRVEILNRVEVGNRVTLFTSDDGDGRYVLTVLGAIDLAGRGLKERHEVIHGLHRNGNEFEFPMASPRSSSTIGRYGKFDGELKPGDNDTYSLDLNTVDVGELVVRTFANANVDVLLVSDDGLESELEKENAETFRYSLDSQVAPGRFTLLLRNRSEDDIVAYSATLRKNLLVAADIGIDNTGPDAAIAIDDGFVRLADNSEALQANVFVAGDDAASRKNWFSFAAEGGQILNAVVDSPDNRAVEVSIYDETDVSAPLVTGLLSSGEVLRFTNPKNQTQKLLVETTSNAPSFVLTLVADATVAVGMTDAAVTFASFPNRTLSTLLAFNGSFGRNLHFAFPDSEGGYFRDTTEFPVPAEVNSSRCPFFQFFGIAATANTFLVAACDSPIVEIDTDGNVLREIANPGSIISGMAFVEGQLILTEWYADRITVVDYSTGNLVRRYNTNVGYLDAVTFDGIDVLVGAADRLYKMDRSNGELEFVDQTFGDIDGLAGTGDLIAYGGFGIQFRSLVDYEAAAISRPRLSGDMEGLGGFTPSRQIQVIANANVGDNLVFAIDALTDSLPLEYEASLFNPFGELLDRRRLVATQGELRVEINAEDVGSYRLELRPATAYAFDSPFLIRVDGATNATGSLSARAINLAERIGSAVDQVWIEFDNAIDESSLLASDLTVDGMPATNVRLLSPSRAVFEIPKTTDGEHMVHMATGSVAGAKV